MTAIVLIVLQILFLLLKAHLARDDDQEAALAHVREAQERLSQVAADFESNLRYMTPPQEQVDRAQDALDEDRKGRPS